MSYFDDASLVMIPSGYKTSKVYSVKPTDGSGDLTFSRSNDTATRVNSAGLIEKVRTNLLTYSQDFSQAIWTKDNVTLTGGQTDPLGGSNGWRFNETTANGQHRFYYTFLSFTSGSMTQSVYVKSLGRDQIFFGSNSNAESLVFTFSTETISNVTGYSSTSVTNVGNGWYRLSATFFGFSPINCCFVQGYSGGSVSYTGDTSKGFFAFGAQIEASDFGATPYIATTTAAVSVGPVANVPRLDYLNSSCPRLLLEPQRTNLALYSEQFNNGYWDKFNVTISANNATAPDGTLSADKIVADANNSNHATYKQTLISSGSATISVYAKASGYNFIFLSDTLSLDRSAYFNLSNGTLGIVGSSATASIQNAGNGWYRCSITFTAVSGSGLGFDLASANGTLVSTGNNVDGILLWGAQLEAGAYATSYIPTLGAAVTRGADACSKTGISSLIGQTEGTLFVEFDLTNANAEVGQIAQLGTGSERVYIFKNLANSNVYQLATQSASGYNFVDTSAITTSTVKIAIAYKSGQNAFYVNGTLISTASATANPTSLSQFDLTNASLATSVKINQALLFKSRLTNAQLAELTTL